MPNRVPQPQQQFIGSATAQLQPQLIQNGAPQQPQFIGNATNQPQLIQNGAQQQPQFAGIITQQPQFMQNGAPQQLMANKNSKIPETIVIQGT